MKALGLYLHFPFCVQKCRYCDFPSCEGKEELMAPYLEALLQEIESYRKLDKKYQIATIFMGGGTPTLFNGHSLVKVLEKCRETFDIEKDAEISIECNPGTVAREKLNILWQGGFNRLSVGLQAWQNHHLKYLGRIHKQQHFVDTIKFAKEAGFDNISADVIYGIPNQNVTEWLTTLKETVACGITHLSAYGLKVEEGTVFHKWLESGKLKEMDDELERELYHKGIDQLSQLGLDQYEISNFAKAGYECRHNLIYWKNGEYIGCGSGAHGHMNGIRKGNIKDIDLYINRIENGKSVIDMSEVIDEKTELLETLMLGFRLREGIIKEDFYKKYGFSIKDRFPKEIELLKERELLCEDNNSIRPTPLGLDFQNTIVLTFMD